MGAHVGAGVEVEGGGPTPAKATTIVGEAATGAGGGVGWGAATGTVAGMQWGVLRLLGGWPHRVLYSPGVASKGGNRLGKESGALKG